MKGHLIALGGLDDAVVLPAARKENDRDLLDETELHGGCGDAHVPEDEDLVDLDGRDLDGRRVLLAHDEAFVFLPELRALLHDVERTQQGVVAGGGWGQIGFGLYLAQCLPALAGLVFRQTFERAAHRLGQRRVFGRRGPYIHIYWRRLALGACGRGAPERVGLTVAGAHDQAAQEDRAEVLEAVVEVRDPGLGGIERKLHSYAAPPRRGPAPARPRGESCTGSRSHR